MAGTLGAGTARSIRAMAPLGCGFPAARARQMRDGGAACDTYVGCMSETEQAHRVLIVGGGPAAIEAALALQRLAGDRVTTTVLAPEANLTYRPLSVRLPAAAG